MQQFSSLLSWRLFRAQHVSGVFAPIIRSSMTAVAASGFTFVSWWQSCCVRGRAGRSDRPRTQHGYHHDTKVKPEAATALIELLMMGGKTPETCWAVNKRQNNKLKNCCIWLVIYLNSTMIYGLTNLKFKICDLIAARVGEFFSFSGEFVPVVGSRQHPILQVMAALSSEAEQPGRKTDHSSSTSKRLRTTGGTPSFPHMPSLCAQVQICLFKSTLL
jgi:hypothetical protein